MEKNKLAPVLLFTYKRLDTVAKTVGALQANALAVETDLFIFSDGPRNETDKKKIEEVIKFLENVTGFNRVVIKKSPANKGLAKSIIEGVSEVLTDYPSCIVMEDDLVTSSNFLMFMNKSLRKYDQIKKIFSISGFTFPIDVPATFTDDAYFNRRGCSWGWATWNDRWASVDWKLLDDPANEKDIYKTNILGSDFPSLIKKYQKGTIDSWAVPWCYFQYKHDLLTLYPTISKVKNIGFDLDATHTLKTEKRFTTYLDISDKERFSYPDRIGIVHSISDQYTKRFSYYQRLKWRLIYDVKKVLRMQ